MKPLVDPMRPLRPEPPRRQQAKAPANETSAAQTTKQQGLKIEPRRRIRLPKRYIVAALLLTALLFSPETIGQILVLVYGVLTILRRFSMLQTFILAALLLLISPLFTWLTGSEENGSVLAGYSFVLLGLGLVQLILAYRRVSDPSGLRQ